MTQLLDPVETLLDAILMQGRGIDGALGLAAQRCALTAGSFRRVFSALDLDTDGSIFDRGYRLEWPSSMDDAPRNPLDGHRLESHFLRLRVGYVFAANSTVVHKRSVAENVAEAAKRAQARAHSDASMITQALMCPTLYQVAGADPAITDIQRQGSTSIDDLGNGRIVTVTDFRVRLWMSNIAFTP